MKKMNWLRKPMKEYKLSRLDKIKMAAILVSLGAHTVFIITSGIFHIPPVVVPLSNESHLFHVKIARDEKVALQQPPKVTQEPHETAFQFESPTSAKNIKSFLEKEREASK